jgi:hypothetical protein
MQQPYSHNTDDKDDKNIQDLHKSLNNNRIVKSVTLDWECSPDGETRNIYRIMVRKNTG